MSKKKAKKTPSGSKGTGAAKVKGKGAKMSEHMNGSGNGASKSEPAPAAVTPIKDDDSGIVEDDYGKPAASSETPEGAPENVREAVDNLKKAAANGDPTALDVVDQIVINFNNWRTAKTNQKIVNKRCKEAVEQEEAAFKNAVEDPLPAGKVTSHALEKLNRVEQRWQEYQHVKAQAIEDRKAATSEVKLWAKKLERSVEEGAQLSLDGIS